MNAQNLAVESELSTSPRMRCLWISKDIPFPQNAGDRIYSANLAHALANANFEVRFLGYFNAYVVQPYADVNWLRVNGEKRGKIASVLNSKPHVAATHDTAEFRQLLDRQLTEQWDAIILDGYASGWALPQCMELQRKLKGTSKGKTPTIIYVSHNHETSVWHAMSRASSKVSIKGLLVWQNYLKVRALEQQLLRSVDVITTITQDDARLYRADTPATFPTDLVLTPGYASTAQSTRVITPKTPRHVVLLGSFHWAVKQENLRQLFSAADAIFAKHQITLDVIGDVPEKLRHELSANAKATQFHGFVVDPKKFMDDARIAIVPEVVGGGFKLKFLDYVFNRIPVFTLTAALAGVPAELARHMTCSTDLPRLVDDIVQSIDDIDKLNALQTGAYQAAMPLFRWQDRGDALANLIRVLRCA